MGPGQLEVDAVSLSAFPPTAAGVLVSGRVTSAKGNGISGAYVSLVAPSGNVRTVTTSPLGYYQFEEVEAGQSYLVSVSKKGYLFADNPRIITINDEMSDLNFTAF
jgi:hypothetical protein